MLTNDVLLKKFPLIPRRGWTATLKSSPVTELRTYEDEPLILTSGQLVRCEYSINTLVTPKEAAQLIQLDNEAKGTPILFQDPLDNYATRSPLMGTRGDITRGYLVRTGNQLMPVKVYQLTNAAGQKTQYVKPIYYVEDLSTNGVDTIFFDSITRIGFEVFNVQDLVRIGSAIPAQFSYWNCFRIESLDVGQSEDNANALAVDPNCEIEHIPVSLSLVESYDWMVDDQMVQVALPLGVAGIDPPACTVSAFSGVNSSVSTTSLAPFVFTATPPGTTIVQPALSSASQPRTQTITPGNSTAEGVIAQVYTELLDYVHAPQFDGFFSPQTDLAISLDLQQTTPAEFTSVYYWAIRQGDFVYRGPSFASSGSLSSYKSFTSAPSGAVQAPGIFAPKVPVEVKDADSFSQWWRLSSNTLFDGGGKPDFTPSGLPIYFGIINSISRIASPSSGSIVTNIRNFRVTMGQDKTLRLVHQVSKTVSGSLTASLDFSTPSINSAYHYMEARELIGSPLASAPDLFVPSGVLVTSKVTGAVTVVWSGACEGQDGNVLKCVACPDKNHSIQVVA